MVKCPICQQDIPAVMQEAHEAAHRKVGDHGDDVLAAPGGAVHFWSWCLLLGAFAGLVVWLIVNF